VWRYDSRPACYIAGRDVIRESSETAGYTGESALVRTISLRDTTAYRTGSRGIPGIDGNNRNAHECGFVGDKGTQLCERPRGLCSTLRPASRNPGAYANQFFDGNSSFRAFGLCYKFLGDTVVRIGCEPSFFGLAFLQKALRGDRAFALKFSAKSAVSMAESIDRSAREHLSIRVDGYVPNAEIDTEYAVNVDRVGFLDIRSGEKEEVAIAKNKVRFALPGLKKLFCSFATSIRYLHPACDRPDGDELLIGVPTEDSVIECDTSVNLKPALGSPVELVGISDLCDTANNHLGGQVELGANGRIRQLVEIILAKDVAFPCPFRDTVTGRVGGLNRLFQRFVLFLRRQEFYLCSKFHLGLSIVDSQEYVKYGRREVVGFPFYG
jgi:hypothetical protein